MSWTPKTFVPDDEHDNSKEWTPKSFVADEGDDNSEPKKKIDINELSHALNPGMVDTINQIGGTVQRGLSTFYGDLANTAIDAGEYLNKGAAKLLGYDPNKIPTAERIIPESIPMVGVKPEDEPGLNEVAKEAAHGAEIATGLRAGTEALKAGIEKGGEALNFIKGKLGEPINVDEKPTAFINKLLNGTNIEDTTTAAAKEVRGKYSNIQEAFEKIYDAMKGKIADRGYSPAISKNFPGISVATDEKAINPNRFDNKLSSLDLEKYSPDIKKSINKFNQNPSFNQAHDLQSELGKESSALGTSKDSKDRLVGKELSSLRRSLLKDIDNTFIKNGDQDLLDEYKAIGQQYKVKSAPYVANPTLRNIVLKKDVNAVNPSTIGNLLKKKDAATSLIRGDLSNRTKDLLFANEMKGAIKEIPNDDGTSSRVVDRDKLIKLYTTADNKGLNYLKTPEKNAFIASLMNDVEKEKYKQSMTNKLAKIGKWGAGLGLAGLSLDELRRKLRL